MDKSIDKYPVKTATKRTGENGIKSRTQMSDGSQLKNPLNRVISKGVNKNTGNSAQRSSLASISGHCSSVVRYYFSFQISLLLLQLHLTNYTIILSLTSL